MKLYTIGFSTKSALEFFELLKSSNVKILIDIRLNNKSQLAGFTKSKDLPYFLDKICNTKYIYMPQLAPTKELLDGYKNKNISWDEYEKIYIETLNKREVAKKIDIEDFEDGCFLCSEPTANRCHRRLAAEYLQSIFKEIKITHL